MQPEPKADARGNQHTMNGAGYLYALVLCWREQSLAPRVLFCLTFLLDMLPKNEHGRRDLS